MCTEVLVVSGHARTYCETVGELALALGVAPESISADGHEFCLCNVDFDRLGARKATDAEGWPNPAFVIETNKDGAP